MRAREKVIQAHRALLSSGGKFSYFEERGISAETLRAAWVGYDAVRRAFTYPCIAGGGLLGIHYKSEERDQNGKRRQWWGGYAEDLPPKGRGKSPGDPAKIIPFGLETLTNLELGSGSLRKQYVQEHDLSPGQLLPKEAGFDLQTPPLGDPHISSDP